MRGTYKTRISANRVRPHDQIECPSLSMRNRSSCEDQPHVTGDQFVAGFAHHVTADAGAEVKAFNAYAVWCKDQTLDDRRQQETLDVNIASTNAAIENFAAFFGSDVDQKAHPDISAAGSSEAQSRFFILGNGIVQLLKIAGKVTDHAFDLLDARTSVEMAWPRGVLVIHPFVCPRLVFLSSCICAPATEHDL